MHLKVISNYVRRWLSGAALKRLVGGVLVLATIHPILAESDKPVLLYSRHYNAQGETRYLPDGSYRDVLTALKEHFEVRVDDQRPSRSLLRDVDVVLISNPSLEAVGDHPAPPHLEARDRRLLLNYIRRGGGLIVMGNQENHNLETEAVNQLFAPLGLEWVDDYTDAKALKIADKTPVLGGLTWGYYTGNLIRLTPAKGVQRWVVINDLDQPPLTGKRDAAGALLAGVQYGKGRLVAVTDSGWINNSVLAGEGLGGTVLPGDQNLEIFKRLCLWATGEAYE